MIRRLFRSWKRLRRRYEFMAEDPAYQEFQIGRYTYGSPLVMFGEKSALTIGSFCSIAEGVRILLGGNHRTDWVTTYPFIAMRPFSHFASIPGHPASKGPVTIGNDVWIAQDALILSGVKIGNGAVIGAHAVVGKDVPPYGVAVGNPARVVKMRFPPEVVDELLRIRWWDWPLERIEEHLPLMLSPDIQGFLNQARKYG